MRLQTCKTPVVIAANSWKPNTSTRIPIDTQQDGSQKKIFTCCAILSVISLVGTHLILGLGKVLGLYAWLTHHRWPLTVILNHRLLHGSCLPEPRQTECFKGKQYTGIYFS